MKHVFWLDAMLKGAWPDFVLHTSILVNNAQNVKTAAYLMFFEREGGVVPRIV